MTNSHLHNIYNYDIISFKVKSYERDSILLNVTGRQCHRLRTCCTGLVWGTLWS